MCFFILSGASLWLAYAEKMPKGYSQTGFFAVYIFRQAFLSSLAVVLPPPIVGSPFK